jgi:hypothetical protein
MQNKRQTFNGAAQHLKVDVSGLLCNADVFSGQGKGSHRIALLKQAERSFPHFKPGAFRAGRQPVKQPAGASQPSVGNDALTAKGPVIPCQPNGDSGRFCAILAGQIQTISPFSGIEYEIGEIEPPSGAPKPFKGFGKLTYAKRSFKGFACLRLSATCERIVAGKTLRWSRQRHRTGVSL